MSPFGGAGAGMFGGVGIGATVAVIEIKVDSYNSYYAWLGVIYKPAVSKTTINENPTTYSKANIEKADTIKAKGKNVSNDEQFVNFGIPDPFETYQDDGVPGKITIKSPGGHSLSLHDKATSQTLKRGVECRSALGKTLILEDSTQDPVNGISSDDATDPSNNSNESIKGNKVLLMDENGNRIVLHTKTVKGDNIAEIVGIEEIQIRAGKSLQLAVENPQGFGDLSITNYGNGGIEIKNDSGKIKIDSAGVISIDTTQLDVTTNPILIPFTVDGVTLATLPGILINKLPVVVRVS
jgi:hypothetical protein